MAAGVNRRGVRARRLRPRPPPPRPRLRRGTHHAAEPERVRAPGAVVDQPPVPKDRPRRIGERRPSGHPASPTTGSRERGGKRRRPPRRVADRHTAQALEHRTSGEVEPAPGRDEAEVGPRVHFGADAIRRRSRQPRRVGRPHERDAPPPGDDVSVGVVLPATDRRRPANVRRRDTGSAAAAEAAGMRALGTKPGGLAASPPDAQAEPPPSTGDAARKPRRRDPDPSRGIHHSTLFMMIFAR